MTQASDQSDEREANAMRVVERGIGYSFNNLSLLRQALTHRSAGAANNERLEFLGDAILNLTAAAELFEQRPRADEGALSRLRAAIVREESLSELARALELGDALRMGEGELRSGGYRRASILADAVEAVIAAVYLDADLDTAVTVCRNLLEDSIKKLPDSRLLKDAKTRLQEWLQGRGLALPEYIILDEQGPAHRRRFQVECRLENGVSSQAVGSSRRAAEQGAAASMLETLANDDATEVMRDGDA